MANAHADHLLLRIRPDVTVTTSEHEVTLRFDKRRLLRYRAEGRLRELLLELARGHRSLAAIVADTAGAPPAELGRTLFLLRRLALTGTLTYTIRAGDRALGHIDTVASSPLVLHEAPLATAPLRLSRFAYVRNVSGELALETPLTPVRVRIVDPSVLHLLWDARAEGSSLGGDAAGAAVRTLVPMLHAARILVSANGSDGEEAGEGALVSWDFHDLLFHARSRMGRSPGALGGTYRFLDRFAAPSVVRARDGRDGEPIALTRPDLESLCATDETFTSVLERRASIRQNGPPLTLAQLGEFLFRTSRIKSIARRGPDDISYRVTAGGGARHVLDVYALVRECEGLAPGLYRYDPLEHSLIPRHGGELKDAAELVEDARLATGEPLGPQVLLVLCARFRRMSWKYEAMSYTTIIKDAGALIQTMYLVATAMKLAPCAIGSGDSDLFARAAAVSYVEETSVAEFALGTLSPEDTSLGPPEARAVEPQ